MKLVEKKAPNWIGKKVTCPKCGSIWVLVESDQSGIGIIYGPRGREHSIKCTGPNCDAEIRFSGF